MKKATVASVLLFGLATFATPALAADKWWVTVDSVGNCSIVHKTPTGGLSAGKTALGDADGYDSMDAAKKFLNEVRNDTSKCKGVVE